MRGEAEKTNLVMTCVNDKNNTIVNHPSNFPSKYKPPTPPSGGLVLGNCPQIQSKQSKKGKFPSNYKAPQSILKQFPSIDKPLAPNISPSKNKPLKKALRKAYFRNFTVT